MWLAHTRPIIVKVWYRVLSIGSQKVADHHRARTRVKINHNIQGFRLGNGLVTRHHTLLVNTPLSTFSDQRLEMVKLDHLDQHVFMACTISVYILEPIHNRTSAVFPKFTHKIHSLRYKTHSYLPQAAAHHVMGKMPFWSPR